MSAPERIWAKVERTELHGEEFLTVNGMLASIKFDDWMELVPADLHAATLARAERAEAALAEAVEEERRRMMEWCAKRQAISRKSWERAARKALAGDMSDLRNRIAMIDAGPMDIVLSDKEARHE